MEIEVVVGMKIYAQVVVEEAMILSLMLHLMVLDQVVQDWVL